MGDDNFPRLPGPRSFAVTVNRLHDNIFGSDMHASCRTLMCDKTRVPSPVAICYRASEYLLDITPLFIIKSFGRDKRRLHSGLRKIEIGISGVIGQQRQR